MNPDDRELRKELIEARAKVKRQIEIEESSDGPFPAGLVPDGRAAVIGELRAELAQLEEALARLG
ncbi:MAG TPA: hypothetical protein VN805_10075 [Caulobacteraceae bacterium]|nr:hypothetical protein [Caulobacteraceae bacterium]